MGTTKKTLPGRITCCQVKSAAKLLARFIDETPGDVEEILSRMSFDAEGTEASVLLQLASVAFMFKQSR